MRSVLFDLYRGNDGLVAYVDESFELRGDRTFYILSCALVASEFIVETRGALLEYYGGGAMHATDMNHRRELASLGGAVQLAAGKHDGMDVVVSAPVAPEDQFGAQARAACIGYIAPLVQQEDGVRLFIFDKPDRPAAEKRDQFTISDLRRAGRLVRETVVAHVRPSEEPILALADLLAWSYRQEFARGVTEWFEPLRRHTRVHVLT